MFPLGNLQNRNISGVGVPFTYVYNVVSGIT